MVLADAGVLVGQFVVVVVVVLDKLWLMHLTMGSYCPDWDVAS